MQSVIVYCLLAILLSPWPAFGQAPTTSEIPPLRPAKPEIAPTFWEEYSTWLILAGLTVLSIILLAVKLGLKPRTEVPVPPATQARKALAGISSTSDHAALLADVSAILRCYFTARFELNGDQLTNTELSSALQEHPQITPELAKQAVELLQDMEQRRFGSAPNTVERTAVQSAVDLVDRTEECLSPAAAEQPSNRPRA